MTKRSMPLTKESSRSLSGKGGRRKSLLSSLCGSNTVGKWELDVLLSELHSVVTLEVSSLNSCSPDDLNGTRTGTMTSSHFVVKLCNCTSDGKITVFTVHIMGTRTGLVTKPDSVILDDTGVLLNDFNTVEDFSSGLLHLTELVHVVPELGFSNNSVGCKDNHAVCLWVRVLISSSLTAYYLVSVHFSTNSHFLKSN